MTHLLGKHDNEKVIPSRVQIKINGRRVGVHKYNKRGNKNILLLSLHLIVTKKE